MDLYGKDKGNVSLPSRLQSRDFKETKLKDIIINTQKCLYNLKIAESNKRIQRYLFRKIFLVFWTYINLRLTLGLRECVYYILYM